MRVSKAISLLFVILVLAAGCRSMTGESAGQNIDDSTITTEVKAKLSAERASNLTRVSVATANVALLLRTRRPDRGLDLLLHGRRQHRRHAEALDPQLAAPAQGTIEVLVILILDLLVGLLQDGQAAEQRARGVSTPC